MGPIGISPGSAEKESRPARELAVLRPTNRIRPDKIPRVE